MASYPWVENFIIFMNEQIQAIQLEVESFLISNEAELEQFRIAFVGRKGFRRLPWLP